jgi:dihydrofolate reductase
MRIVVINHLTLDGVTQAPGRPDEDRRGGFPHGGWGAPYGDAVMADAMGFGPASASRRDAGASGGGLLLGRRTYEDFYRVWPNATNNPYTEVLNKARKYVASRTLKEPLPWSNSTLLEGDAVEAVARLKKEPGKDLIVLGSAELVQSLLRANLVDEFMLPIHPLVLGTGRRLFPEGGAFARLQLVDSKTTTTGVIIATYRPA